MRCFRQAFSRSCWQSSKLAVCQGLTTPPAMVRLRSGRARDSSISMIRPKPRQAGQAPRGWLNEKRAGVGS
ncbi:MAG: hypothetical protein EBT48_00525 [Verrucomicrobia bacterium]|nr:hypothetical protein [Verrucomicrobiota bacterium]